MARTSIAAFVPGGELRSRKGLNLPGIDLGISAFTERDRECLKFALAHGVDAVSQSFVESAADIQAVREAARSFGGDPFILAKIERSRALEHVDEILAAADGIMVARGDLGVEVPIEHIAILQKTLVRKAVRLGKPVIIATQMLESMTHSRQPTRAEATDVANAVLDGADCVMLSGESATGEFPVEAVATLARIAAATEPHRERADLWERLKTLPREVELQHRGPSLAQRRGGHRRIVAGRRGRADVQRRHGPRHRTLPPPRLDCGALPTAPRAVRNLQFTYGIEPVPMRQVPAEWTTFTRDWVHAEHCPAVWRCSFRALRPETPMQTTAWKSSNCTDRRSREESCPRPWLCTTPNPMTANHSGVPKAPSRSIGDFSIFVSNPTPPMPRAAPRPSAFCQ